ncbi:MAG TPA: hypothetical protein VMB03_21445 [Bryobacteraceae bacterium]|nr:hypothetical protein [Bryobacteraceae bacterium]
MLARAETYARNLSSGFCEQKYRLLDDFLDAVRELNLLHTQQTQAVIAGDRDFTRFDILIFMAQEKKESAKYAWIAHIESHRCEDELWRLAEPKENEYQTID